MNFGRSQSLSVPLCLSFLVFLALLSFGRVLTVGFLWDDHEMIEKNPVIKSVSAESFRHIFTHDVFEGHGDRYYRPVQSLTYMIDFAIWGLRPFGFHLTNLCFHL